MSNINPMPLIWGLRDARLSPDRFDMQYWCLNKNQNEGSVYLAEVNQIRHDCGTVMCLAGWASAYVLAEQKDGTNWAIDDAVIYKVCGEDDSAGFDLRCLFSRLDDSLDQIEAAVYAFVGKHAPDYLSKCQETLAIPRR